MSSDWSLCLSPDPFQFTLHVVPRMVLFSPLKVVEVNTHPCFQNKVFCMVSSTFIIQLLLTTTVSSHVTLDGSHSHTFLDTWSVTFPVLPALGSNGRLFLPSSPDSCALFRFIWSLSSLRNLPWAHRLPWVPLVSVSLFGQQALCALSCPGSLSASTRWQVS